MVVEFESIMKIDVQLRLNENIYAKHSMVWWIVGLGNLAIVSTVVISTSIIIYWIPISVILFVGKVKQSI